MTPTYLLAISGRSNIILNLCIGIFTPPPPNHPYLLLILHYPPPHTHTHTFVALHYFIVIMIRHLPYIITIYITIIALCTLHIGRLYEGGLKSKFRFVITFLFFIVHHKLYIKLKLDASATHLISYFLT